MIKEVNQKVNEFNKKIGLDIKLPMPSKAALEVNEKVNVATSVTCLTLGVLTSSKWLFGLGVLSGLSAIFTHTEKKKV